MGPLPSESDERPRNQTLAQSVCEADESHELPVVARPKVEAPLDGHVPRGRKHMEGHRHQEAEGHHGARASRAKDGERDEIEKDALLLRIGASASCGGGRYRGRGGGRCGSRGGSRGGIRCGSRCERLWGGHEWDECRRDKRSQRREEQSLAVLFHELVEE